MGEVVDFALKGPHRVGNNEGLVEIKHDSEAPEIEHPDRRRVEPGAHGAAPEARHLLHLARHCHQVQFLVSNHHHRALVLVEAGEVEAVKAGVERLGLELASHGEGRDGLEYGEGRAALAGRREVADADLVAGEGQGPLGPGLNRENLGLAEGDVAVEHPHGDPASGRGRRGGGAGDGRRGPEHRHGGGIGGLESGEERGMEWREGV